MTNDTKWAVTVHRNDKDKDSTVLHIADSAEAAIKSAAENLDLKVDATGNVTGDDEITRLTAEAAPDAPERRL